MKADSTCLFRSGFKPNILILIFFLVCSFVSLNTMEFIDRLLTIVWFVSYWWDAENWYFVHSFNNGVKLEWIIGLSFRYEYAHFNQVIIHTHIESGEWNTCVSTDSVWWKKIRHKNKDWWEKNALWLIIKLANNLLRLLHIDGDYKL